ncbi:sulfite reductase [Rhodococcus sp. JVH1]|uniref:sulfite reductase n=1 Tax=Rhodococcus sp. JVH1 TaxID=745408 RepID=UPI0002720E2A|nr:sulfite reductase [Rhodococcus sp. JVH1]EJI95870.1 sulfite reductase [Rhodococcus sp. JVH1]
MTTPKTRPARAKSPRAEGKWAQGDRVHLGGGLGMDKSFERKLRRHKLPTTEVPDYVERIVRRYAADRAGSEKFATWVQRATEADLA